MLRTKICTKQNDFLSLHLFGCSKKKEKIIYLLVRINQFLFMYTYSQRLNIVVQQIFMSNTIMFPHQLFVQKLHFKELNESRSEFIINVVFNCICFPWCFCKIGFLVKPKNWTNKILWKKIGKTCSKVRSGTLHSVHTKNK